MKEKILIGLFVLLALWGAPFVADASYVPTSPLTDPSWQQCGQILLDRIETINQGEDVYDQFGTYITTSPGPGIDPSTCRMRSNGLTAWATGTCQAQGRCNFFTTTNGFQNGVFSSNNVERGPGTVYNSETGMPTAGISEIPRSEWNCVNPRESQDNGQFYITKDCSAEGTDMDWREVCRVNADREPIECYVEYGGIGNEQRSATYAGNATNVSLVDPTTGSVTFSQDGRDLSSERRGIIENLFSGLKDISIRLVSAIIFYVTEFIVWILLAVLALIAWLLDAIVIEFVIQMGKYATSPDAVAVKAAWVMVRDIANIGIIAGLVATAVGTIVGTGNYSISKTLARLILAALLVNFSYFFAGAIIDFSNFTARAAYYSLVTTEGCSGENCGPAGRLLQVIDLNSFRARAGDDFAQGAIQSASGVSDAQSNASSLGETGSRSDETSSISRLATFNVMTIIFIIIFSFVLLSVISLLIARFIALIFLLITSPIGIAGGSVPILKTYADEWWKTMWSQAMFAPVYFVLLGIALNIIDQFGRSFEAGTYAVNVAGGMLQSTIGIMVMFILAIGFTWTALSTAKKMSEEGGRFKDLYGGVNKLAGWLPGAYKTAGGIVLRDTVGRQLHHWDEGYRKFAAKHNLANFQGGKKIPLIGGLVNGMIRGTVAGADRALQTALHKGGNAEFVKGVAGFEKTKQAKLQRESLLGEVKREEEQLENYRKKAERANEKEKAALEQQKDRDAKKGETGADDDDKYWGRQALRDLKIRKKNGEWESDEETRRRIGIGSNEELLKEVVGKDGKKRKQALSADELAAKYGDKIKLKDADGNLESDAELKARLKGQLADGLGRKRRINSKGEYVAEDVYDYDERIDKMKDLEGDDGLSFRDARADAESIFSTFTHDFIKRKYEEDPESIVPLAKWAPYDKFKQINDDKSIRRDLRDNMASARWGKYAQEVAEVQAAVDRGEIVEFGEEYQKRMLGPYQYMQNNMKSGTEFEDFLRSTGGIEVTDKSGSKKQVKFEDLRNMRAMQHAFSSTTFVKMKDAKIFGTTEQRNMNTNKRKNITNDRDEWAAIELAYGHQDNEWAVPNIGGTTNYNAAQRARNTVKEQIKVLSGVASNPNAIASEREAAQKRIDFLNKLSREQAAVESSWSSARFADGTAVGNDRASRDRYIREEKQKLRSFQISANMDETERAQKIADLETYRENASDLQKMIDRQIELEGGYDAENPSGVPGWQKGKSEQEAAGILGKREVVSPPIVASLDVDRFQSLYMAGHDKVEKDLMWNMMMIYGKPEVVEQILTNQQLRQMVSVPAKGTQLRNAIDAERKRVWNRDLEQEGA